MKAMTTEAEQLQKRIEEAEKERIEHKIRALKFQGDVGGVEHPDGLLTWFGEKPDYRKTSFVR